MAAKVAWLLGDKVAETIARDWSKADSDLRWILDIACTSPNIDGTAYDVFLRVALAMIKEEVVPLNPIVSDAFTFIREVATGFGRPLPAWLATLQRLALTDKLHLAGCENAPLDFDVPDDAKR